MKFGQDKGKDNWEKIRQDVELLLREDPAVDPGERVLCADEACIGLVGEDGRCRLCGMPFASAERSKKAEAEDEPGKQVLNDEPASAEALVKEAEEESEEDLSDRVLCADGNCIGIVGPDGYCKLCGLRWKPEGYSDGEAFTYRDESED